LVENLSVNSLKGDLSNATTFNPPLFPLDNTFKMTFVPHTEFKGSPAYVTPNLFYSTSFKNFPSFSLQVPSILSILLIVIRVYTLQSWNF
jgi:hypothetical protein